MKPIYTHKWNKETGLSICNISYNGYNFTGIAQCAPEDEKYASEITGGNIATWRAELAYLRHIRRSEILPKIKALDHVIGTMMHSQQFDHTHYEFKRLWKEFQNLQDEYIEVNEEIMDTEQTLKSYIAEKDRTFRRLDNKGQK